MIELAVLVALATLAVGLVVAIALRQLPTVRLQLAGLALLAVVLPLSVVLLSGWVMFHMGDDVKILAVAAASASTSVVVALLVARPIAREIEGLGNASRALAAGDLRARAPEEGPDELVQLARSFNEMADNLSRLFDARRELVAWASHDLRTPIASLQAMLEAVEDGLADPERYLPRWSSRSGSSPSSSRTCSSWRGSTQVRSRLELQEAELVGLIESCIRGVEAQARARNVSVEARARDPVWARCAPDQVQRVLYNLLANAVRHTPSDGAVAVHAQSETEEVRIVVEDTGDGLTPETASRMFERFWREDGARTSGGAGLGLAIARGLVEAHGGRIWAESRPEGGTRVSFTLPAVA